MPLKVGGTLVGDERRHQTQLREGLAKSHTSLHNNGRVSLTRHTCMQPHQGVSLTSLTQIYEESGDEQDPPAIDTCRRQQLDHSRQISPTSTMPEPSSRRQLM
jgi:hypothetical protein